MKYFADYISGEMLFDGSVFLLSSFSLCHGYMARC